MTVKHGHLVERVTSGSPAEAAGIKAGWRLLRIDNQTIGDIIDYKIFEADEELRLLMMNDQGTLRRIKIKKPAATPLGMQFDPPTISRLQRCRNRCIFCFIEQNPRGLRAPLYIKDDDYRLSFLYGNFITLNRLTDSEIARIIRLQLSPLYVSVQTTNPELRRVMFNSKHADRGTNNLKRLVKAGIRFHAQIVLCPGYNTGAEMERTIKELDLMGTNILSVALVPVGLTGYRSCLPQLQRFDSCGAEKLIERVNNMQKGFLQTRGSRFVFAADEFYNLAGLPLPAGNAYEDFPQLENGVGLARQFMDELEEIENWQLKALPGNLSATVVSGLAAEPQLKKLVAVFEQIKKLTVNPLLVKNLFFGEQITVSGLLTGSDLLAALEGKEPGDVVYIPAVLLKENSSLFLDDLALSDLEHVLQVPVCPVSGPLELIKNIYEKAGQLASDQKRRRPS